MTMYCNKHASVKISVFEAKFFASSCVTQTVGFSTTRTLKGSRKSTTAVFFPKDSTGCRNVRQNANHLLRLPAPRGLSSVSARMSAACGSRMLGLGRRAALRLAYPVFPAIRGTAAGFPVLLDRCNGSRRDFKTLGQRDVFPRGLARFSSWPHRL